MYSNPLDSKVKSKECVQEHVEVLTPVWMVKDLLNLLDWSVNIMYERFSYTKIYPKILYLDKHRKEKSIKAFNFKEQEMLAIAIN